MAACQQVVISLRNHMKLKNVTLALAVKPGCGSGCLLADPVDLIPWSSASGLASKA